VGGAARGLDAAGTTLGVVRVPPPQLPPFLRDERDDQMARTPGTERLLIAERERCRGYNSDSSLYTQSRNPGSDSAAAPMPNAISRKSLSLSHCQVVEPLPAAAAAQRQGAEREGGRRRPSQGRERDDAQPLTTTLITPLGTDGATRLHNAAGTVQATLTVLGGGLWAWHYDACGGPPRSASSPSGAASPRRPSARSSAALSPRLPCSPWQHWLRRSTPRSTTWCVRQPRPAQAPRSATRPESVPRCSRLTGPRRKRQSRSSTWTSRVASRWVASCRSFPSPA
jgi:hypothetical protein